MKMVALLITSLLFLGFQQHAGVGSRLNAREITLPDATSRANGFLNRVSGARLSQKDVRWTVREGLQGRKLEFQDKRHYFEISPSDGRIIMYRNLDRVESNFRRKTLRNSKFKNSSDAKAHLIRLAKKIGVPDDAKLESFEFKQDGQVKDADSSGYFAGRYGKDGYVAIVNCDIYDGALILFIEHVKTK